MCRDDICRAAFVALTLFIIRSFWLLKHCYWVKLQYMLHSEYVRNSLFDFGHCCKNGSRHAINIHTMVPIWLLLAKGMIVLLSWARDVILTTCDRISCKTTSGLSGLMHGCDCFLYFLSEFIFRCFKCMFLYFSVNASYFCHCYCVVNWHYS